MYESILIRKEIEKPNPSIPESFLALVRELHALGLDFSLNKFENSFEQTKNLNQKERDIFKDLETRLKLRALLARKKAEYFAKSNEYVNKNEILLIEKLKEKNKILQKFQENEMT